MSSNLEQLFRSTPIEEKSASESQKKIENTRPKVDIDEILKTTPVEKEKVLASSSPIVSEERQIVPVNQNSNALRIRENDIKVSQSSDIRFVDLDRNNIKNGKIKLKFDQPVQGEIQLRLKGAEEKEEQIPNDRQMIKVNQKIVQDILQKDGNVEQDLVKSPTEKRNFKRSMREELYTQKCLKVRTMTDFWKPLFPKGTVMLGINSKMIQCNYHLYLYILKSFNKTLFEDVDIQSLKSILLKYYKSLLDRTGYARHLGNKWKLEGKSFYYENLMNQRMSIEQIIYDESYQITETDILIASYYMNIPICVLYQSKGKIKLSTFKKFGKHDFMYFIKVNHDNSMYLHTFKNEINFERNILHKDLLNSINSQEYDSFLSYLKTNIRKMR